MRFIWMKCINKISKKKSRQDKLMDIQNKNIEQLQILLAKNEEQLHKIEDNEQVLKLKLMFIIMKSVVHILTKQDQHNQIDINSLKRLLKDKLKINE